MAWGYMFFPPRQLPLTHDMLSEATIGAFADAEAVRATISAHLTNLVWSAGEGEVRYRGSVTEQDGEFENLFEFTIMNHTQAAEPTLIVSIRCSGRFDSAPFAQRLCDATGWIAFDDRAYLFQPHRPPMPGGRR